MTDARYTASKSRTQGRNAWTLTFRHPLCRDDEGRPGVKVRRGLGTSEDSSADALVEEMNALLGDETYWDLTERPRAERHFSDAVVRAFYEPMENPSGADPSVIREGEMPLPDADDGYSRVLFIGTTGTGKTSLLRHLIGSHPKADRFPSTSANKTTIADIEVITSPGDFEAVVTFFPRRLIRTYIAESVLEACKTAWADGLDDRVARDLLNHKEQRFRLSYLLGNWAGSKQALDEGDWGEAAEDEDSEDEPDDPGSLPTSEERSATQRDLETYLKKIRDLAASADTQLSRERGEPLKKLSGDDHEEAVALLLERVEKLPGFAELADTIFDRVLACFSYLTEGRLTKRGGWPEKWTFSGSDRDGFLRLIRWFSSNHSKAWGRLLTPLVQGIRVKGPLAPGFTDEVPRLVLIDGEGLGHTPESVVNVSTHYTSRYPSVDVILLVDSAKQPMQAAPLSVLRSVATSGHQGKLAIAFTHFDAVKGDNLPGFRAKRDHVVGSVKSSLSSLRNAIGDVVSGLESQIDQRCFMLGWLDEPTTRIPAGARKQLAALLGCFEAAIAPPTPAKASPLYDPAGLSFAVQSAAGDFHSLWDARLGYRHRDGVSPEHWARIKALTRRVALRMDNYEYRHLMPIAELIGRLQEAISRFLDAPAKWDPPAKDGDEASAAINRIRAEVNTTLHSFAMERIVERHMAEWAQAFHYFGRGSSRDRAQELRGIYGEAAPIPGVELSEAASGFLAAVRQLVRRAIREGGGGLVLHEE